MADFANPSSPPPLPPTRTRLGSGNAALLGTMVASSHVRAPIVNLVIIPAGTFTFTVPGDEMIVPAIQHVPVHVILVNK